MKQNKQKFLALSAILALSLTGTAQAVLIDRGGGLIYDDELKITWLQDANYAQTSGHDADGRMTWDNAVAWADSLSYGDYNDWRLPTMIDTGTPGCDFAYSGTDCGYNVQTKSGETVYSELAYMFYENLGNLAAYDTGGNFRGGSSGVDWGLTNTGLFSNLQTYVYWSGVEYAPGPAPAWAFDTGFGYQGNDYKGLDFYAWAVRSGDVTASVPAPVPFWLIGSGLMALIGWKRKR